MSEVSMAPPWESPTRSAASMPSTSAKSSDRSVRPPVRKVGARIERAAHYINAHFLQPIRLEDICQAANLSEAYLIRAFEQHFHMTPHAYLLNRRIQHAQTQLLEGEPIAAVAQRSGFADQAHFQRVFKKHLAATPGQYRQ